MLKLRKVELLGFKSFCEKTPITFSGSGITCIVGPNGCGKSNVVDAVSWVLGEQSHKMLRAERMSDCIFNGTAKRPPMGLAEVTLTLVDPELSEAVAWVLDGRPPDTEGSESAGECDEQTVAGGPDGPETTGVAQQLVPAGSADEAAGKRKFRKKSGGEKPAITLKPGEVVVARRLYRSGQSEYLINGRVARLRDIQEIFMGMGLGPDSYAIIEQGRIGQILNSKPMDRRAIIEEAAGITMYKTKRRLAEAKLEASKINLSRVNDILVEVEKQLASLKRQASKARRYAELREQMRGLLRVILASKAEHLDIDAARLANLLREMDAAEERESRTVQQLEAEQERITARTYELDGELRQAQNLLGQTALDLDRTENRITFNREHLAQIESRAKHLAAEIEQAELQSADLASNLTARREAIAALREEAAAREAGLHGATENAAASTAEQAALEHRIEEQRKFSSQLVEESARQKAESQLAEETAVRYAAAEAERLNAIQSAEAEASALARGAEAAAVAFRDAERNATELEAAVGKAQARLAELRREHQQTSQRFEQLRQSLSGERARHASIEKILSERAYTADAVQKLFNASGQPESRGFRVVGLLADYAEVQEAHEAAIEQFLGDELQYVIVESFDHARAGIELLRQEVGGHATFFVDSLKNLSLDMTEAEGELPKSEGILARLDRLVEFRDPLGPAAKHFLPRLRRAYLVENAASAERAANENPHSYYLTPDGTCYHGRMVSGGRQSEAGPLALKRELRHHEVEVHRLELAAQGEEVELARLASEIVNAEQGVTAAAAQHVEAAKELVAATHRLDQARNECQRAASVLAAEREEINRLHLEAETARGRAAEARQKHERALESRAAAEKEATEASSRLAELRTRFQALQEQVAAGREELAAISERLASAEAIEQRLSGEITQANERVESLRNQRETLGRERAELESSCEQLGQQTESLRTEKAKLEERKIVLEKEWEEARSRTAQLDELLRGKRQSLDEIRSERGQRQIEKARNDADRDYLRQTCVAELNAQPEELMAQAPQLHVGEELIAAETNYNEMKARIEAMGPVNMMALEEYRECEEREGFLRRERDDLVQSIENTHLTINELDQVSRQKFEEAFNFINKHFAIAFQSLFGGGHGEMRLGEPDSSGESGIDIAAQPPGKRLQNILLLSGGEKALTALALLIAVFKYQPSPFCILDEVDAPLDEANVGRFNKMLEEMCAQTQFIVVTHNRKTMEMGSVLYGVTMQEPGVSKLVSVKWEEAAEQVERKAASAA